MSSAEDFDYYEALEIDKTATFQEIRESFKRLALIHHPDKNPDDFEDATARFQRINTAHSVLSDEALRADYDNPTADPFQNYRSRSPSSAFADIFIFRFNGGAFSSLADILEALGGGRSYNEGGNWAEMMERGRRAAAREAFEEAERRRIREERRAREEAAETVRQTELEMKKVEVERQKLSRQTRDIEERRLQEERWKSENAITEAEKRTACLHSHFWPKEQYKRKIKCEECGHRRGMTGYRCPYCSLLACQLCLNNFNTERNAR